MQRLPTRRWVFPDGPGPLVDSPPAPSTSAGGAIRPAVGARRVPVATRACDVLVLTARFGSGHRQVSRAVEQALLAEHPGLRVSSADYADILNPALYHGLLAAYTFSLKHWWAAFDWFYRATARFVPGSPGHRWLHGFGQRRMRAVLAATTPRVVVCTFPEEAGAVSELRRRGVWTGRTVVAITDYAAHSQWIHPHIDMYCVPSLEVAADLVARGVPADRVAATGIPLRAGFDFPHDREAVRRALGLDAQDPVAVVMPGPFGDLAQPLLAVRVLLGLPRAVQVVLVAGEERAAERARQQLAEPAPRNAGRLRVLGRVEAMAALMRAADVLVGKAGGVTSAEAVAAGLPLVLFRPLPGQERVNAAFLQAQGAARLADDADGLAAAVREVLERPRVLADMREACGRLALPRAAHELAAIVLSWLGAPGGSAAG